MPELSAILDMLERDDALELQDVRHLDRPSQTPPWWPEIEPTESIARVDYGRLFPGPGRIDRGDYDFEVYDDWTLDPALVDTILTPPDGLTTVDAAPGWDVWAWYQPIHFFGPDWGIYIRETGLVECARRIAHRLPAWMKARPHVDMAVKAALRAAFAILFLHEQYHHKTESLALRMHVVERRPVYPEYHRNVYRKTRGTADQIEEGLANADSWYRLPRESAYKRLIGDRILAVALEYLEHSFTVAPPGYANATKLLTRPAFDAEQQDLYVKVQEGSMTPRRTFPSEFAIATQLNHALFTVNQHIWTIVPAGVPTILPTHPAIAPLQTTRLERVLRHNGCTEVSGGGKGSHRKYRSASGAMIILPNAKDVSLPVLKSTADALGVKVRDLDAIARDV